MSATLATEIAKERLEAEREEVTDALFRGSQPTYEPGGGWQDIDSSFELLLRNLEYGQAEALWCRLRDIEEALRRLDQGTYGRCSGCGRPLSLNRLARDPAVSLCVPCLVSLESRAPSEGVSQDCGCVR